MPLCLSCCTSCCWHAPWAELVGVTCSPIAPNQVLGRYHMQKQGRNQKYICKKAGNFIELFSFEQRSREIRAAGSGGKGSQPRGKSKERPPRERGAQAWSQVTELPQVPPLSCRPLQLSPPLDAEDRGRGCRADLSPTGGDLRRAASSGAARAGDSWETRRREMLRLEKTHLRPGQGPGGLPAPAWSVRG